MTTHKKHRDIIPQHMAAKQCGISRQRLNGWIKSGKVSTHDVMGQRWVSLEEVRDVLADMVAR